MSCRLVHNVHEQRRVKKPFSDRSLGCLPLPCIPSQNMTQPSRFVKRRHEKGENDNIHQVYHAFSCLCQPLSRPNVFFTKPRHISPQVASLTFMARITSTPDHLQAFSSRFTPVQVIRRFVFRPCIVRNKGGSSEWNPQRPRIELKIALISYYIKWNCQG